MLGQACVIILGFADNIMIGWYGVNELASASFVNGIMNLFIFTELGFCNGMTPVIGAGFGRKDRRPFLLFAGGAGSDLPAGGRQSSGQRDGGYGGFTGFPG